MLIQALGSVAEGSNPVARILTDLVASPGEHNKLVFH